MSKIKAILIDVEAKEVREVELQSKGRDSYLDAMYKQLKCDCITSALPHLFNTVGHVMFVDDEGLLKDKPMGAFYIEPHKDCVLSGNAIIVKVGEEGESLSHKLDVDLLALMVEFTDVKNLPEPEMFFIPIK